MESLGRHIRFADDGELAPQSHPVGPFMKNTKILHKPFILILASLPWLLTCAAKQTPRGNGSPSPPSFAAAQIVCNIASPEVVLTAEAGAVDLGLPSEDDISALVGISGFVFHEDFPKVPCSSGTISKAFIKEHFSAGYVCKIGEEAPPSCLAGQMSGWNCMACEMGASRLTTLAFHTAIQGDESVVLVDLMTHHHTETQIAFHYTRQGAKWLLVGTKIVGVI